MLTIIKNADYDEKVFDAKIHNMKMKPRIVELNLSKEERQESTELAKNAFARMQAEFKARKSKNDK